MFRAIFLQAVTTIIAAAVAGLVVGMHGAVSAALGGAVCVLPNFLFALRLSMAARRQGASRTINFFLGEIIKVALTAGSLIFVVRMYPGLHWPSLLIGMGLALQAGLLALRKKS